MSHQQNVLLASVSEIINQEIAARSGEVLNMLQDKTRFFVRSVLPNVTEVLPNDRLQGGVALRATESEVWLSPYVFRLVCSNGAIMAHMLQTQHLSERDWQDPWSAENSLREAIQTCCEPEVFATSAQQFRAATSNPAGSAFSLLSWLHQSGLSDHGLSTAILDQFFREEDRTRFGLVNAVTAVARETSDPEVRWRLEELGGAIAADQTPPSRPRGLRLNPQLRRSLAQASQLRDRSSVASFGTNASCDSSEDASDEFSGIRNLVSQFG